MKYKNQQKKLQKSKILTVFTIFITFVVFVVFNDFGAIKLAKLKKQQYSLEKDVSNLQKQQIKLNTEIHNLQTNIDYIEKIAREKFMMAKPGEKIFRVIEYKTIQ